MVTLLLQLGCQQNGQCARGQICMNGQCQAGGTSTDLYSCTQNLDCQGGSCTPGQIGFRSYCNCATIQTGPRCNNRKRNHKVAL